MTEGFGDFRRVGAYNLASKLASSLGTNLPVGLTLVVAVAVLVPKECDHGPTPLIDGIQSRLNVEQVGRDLQLLPEMWRVEQDWSRNGAHVVVMKVFHFVDLGEPGHLYLHFFDNRLWRAVFYPDHPDQYIGKLEEKIGQSLANDIALSPGTELGRRADGSGRLYMEWTDEILKTEWIARMD
jgi:hypothetical protein